MICIACIAEDREDDAVIETPAGWLCRDHAVDFDYCWNCGQPGDLCFDDEESPLPDGWSGACRNCINDWHDTEATERYHSHLWDVGR